MDKQQRAKIEKFARDALTRGPVKNKNTRKFLEPEVNGKWRRLTDRKWEFRWNEIVMATIFHKPFGQYSLWLKVPDLSQKIHQFVAESFVFDTFDKADQGMKTILADRAVLWCNNVLQIVDQSPNHDK